MMKKKKRGGEGLNQQTDTNFYFLFHKLSNYTQSVFVLTHGCEMFQKMKMKEYVRTEIQS